MWLFTKCVHCYYFDEDGSEIVYNIHIMNKKVITVIDLKAFYSYVECLDRGLDPWTTPLVVGDRSRSVNTIILSVTPYLKSKGVPSRVRMKDLPKGYNYVFATPRMERYIEKSCEVINTFLEFVSEEDMHVYSIDEAFIDLTSYVPYYKKDAKQLVIDIINRVKEKTGLQATAGLGDNFFLAKVALDVFAKKAKDGIGELYYEDVEKKLWPITPLNKIWGIGPRLEARLNRLGMHTMYDVAHANRDLMRNKFGIMGDQLVDQANGIDESDIHEKYEPKEKSLSFGQTLPRDYKVDETRLILKELCDDLASKMRGENMKTDLVGVAIGYSSDKGGFSKQMSLLRATDDTDELYQAIIDLYNRNVIDLPIRQVHISFGHLNHVHNVEQLDLFKDPKKQEERRNLQLMMDEIHNKYGKNILLRASALTDYSTARERHEFIGGHKK